VQAAEGHSGRAFKVEASLERPAPFSRPLPFMLKIDRIAKVEQEHTNYWEYVDPAVPFHLRPRFDLTRCFSGYEFGILVASFVTDSDSLIDVLARGAGQQTMYSLYDAALAGWHSQVSSPSELRTDAVAAHLMRAVDCTFKTFASTRAAAVKAQGCLRTPEALLIALASLPSISYRVSPAHGDLHPSNVRSRRGDAILIDFYSTLPTAPAVFDSAWLEVSTAFSARAAGLTGWREMVDELYDLTMLRKPPAPQSETARANWLHQMIRQIRLFAFAEQETDLEYAQVIAFCLVRYGGFCPKTDAHAKAREVAFILGERLVVQLGA